MKYFLPVKYFCLVVLVFLVNHFNINGQCLPGYSRDTLNWDYLDFLPNTGQYVSPTAFINLAKSQNQFFAFGAQRINISHNYSGTNDPGDDVTHTGSAGSYGSGADVHLIGNGTVTIRFDNPVIGTQLSLYDVDRYQRITVTAFNGLAPVAVTLTRVSGSILTIAGSPGLAPSATANSSRATNTSSDGTVNINVALPVTRIVLTVTNTGTHSSEDGSFWISDIIACSPGSLPNNYYAVSQPFTNQPAYVLVALDNTVYYVNVANGEAKYLFTDPTTTNINSLAYDPYRHMVYFAHSLSGSPATDRTIYRYDYEQDTLGTLTTNVNNLGVPTYDAGVESGAAAFYNGSLYIGIEGYARTGANSDRESAIWKMDFSGAYAPNGNYAQVFAVPGDDGAGTLLHDWSDFGINNGILYDFDGAASNRDFYHKNMLTGGTVNYSPSPATLVPRQVAVDWTGQVYNVGSPSASASGTIVPYNYNGSVNTAQEYDITFNGAAISGSWGDAAEAFKPKTDFGDAPASYDPASGDQATHEVIANLRLGAAVDIEFSKKTSFDASADNFDDGMTSLLIIPRGVVNYLRPVDVYNNTGANATVVGWLDANGDGVFQTSEGRSVIVPSSASMQTVNLFWAFINVTPPIGTTIFMRIRVASSVLGMSTATPNGFYINGEVEDYAIIIANVLPDENVLLQAKKVNNRNAYVNWKLKTESEFSGYELQRSNDGNNWRTIYATNVNAANNLNYSYSDLDPTAPFSYYKVKVLKSSGAILYSDIKKLDFSGNYSVSISPNPAKNQAKITIQSEFTGSAVVELIDYSGRLCHQQNTRIIKGENEIFLTVVQKLNSGLYNVRVLLNGEVLSTTLVVTK